MTSSAVRDCERIESGEFADGRPLAKLHRRRRELPRIRSRRRAGRGAGFHWMLEGLGCAGVAPPRICRLTRMRAGSRGRPRTMGVRPFTSHKPPQRDDRNHREGDEGRDANSRWSKFLYLFCVRSSGRGVGQSHDKLHESGTVVTGISAKRHDGKSAAISSEGDCNERAPPFDSPSTPATPAIPVGKASPSVNGPLDHSICECLTVALMRGGHSQEDDDRAIRSFVASAVEDRVVGHAPLRPSRRQH